MDTVTNFETIDFSTVPDEEVFSLPPEGDYACIVMEGNKNVTKNGTTCINLKWEIMEGPYKGAFIYDSFFLTIKALPRLKKAMAAMGFDITKPISIDPRIFEGKASVVTTEHTTYPGKDGKEKTKSQITWSGYKPWEPGQSIPEPEEPEFDGQVPF